MIDKDNRPKSARELEFVLPGESDPVFVQMDWYGLNKPKLQVLVTPVGHDDPSVSVRFNDNGSIHSIVIDEQLSDLVKLAGGPPDDWMKERDGVTVFPVKPEESTWQVAALQTDFRDSTFSNITKGAF
jgi:hypothetical protein